MKLQKNNGLLLMITILNDDSNAYPFSNVYLFISIAHAIYNIIECSPLFCNYYNFR